ncbi:MAG: hypothetical protein JZU63_08985, partial [Rhodoferax sp.]|nr:hypothetical protein [Rhodoferax sp.]
DISQLASTTWVGASGGSYFDANNWRGLGQSSVGAVPDKSNVAEAIIPVGIEVEVSSTAISDVGINVPTGGTATVINNAGTLLVNLATSATSATLSAVVQGA